MDRWTRWQQALDRALGASWRWVRFAPRLEAWGVLAALLVVAVCQAFDYHEHQLPWMPASGDEVPRDWQQPTTLMLVWNYMAPYVRLLALLGGLVFQIAVMRALPDVRRLQRHTWIACLFLAIWFAGGDFLEQWQEVHSMLTGKPFPIVAHLGKLVLVVLAMLSPAIVLSYYQRSPVWERYVLRSVTEPLVFCLVAFCALWLLADLLDSMRDFQDGKIGAMRLVSFYANLVPYVFVQSSTAALMLATLHALMRLVKSNELVSLLCSGLSLHRLLRPFLFLAAVVSLVSMAMNYDWAQRSEEERAAILRGIQTGQKSSIMASSVMHYHPSTRRMWYVAYVPFELRNQKLRGVEIRQYDAQGNLEMGWSAASAFWWSTGRWSFFRGVQTRYHDNLPERFHLYNEPEGGLQHVDAVGWPETLWDVISGTMEPAIMTVPDLAGYLQDTAHHDDATLVRRFQTELWHRFAYPWQGFALVFLITAITPFHSRRGLMKAAGLTIVLYFVLLFLNSTTLNIARAGTLPPWLVLWLPHAALIPAGVAVLWVRSGAPWRWLAGRRLPRSANAWRWVRGRRTQPALYESQCPLVQGLRQQSSRRL